jgi:catechol 2,3-dioxygenase-like lactoylglutathione lyase family enzyme
MARAAGIGGLFFRADDPEGLAGWYARHLGIPPVPQDYDTPCWRQNAGPTVFAPFARDSEYFGDPARQWMLNLRVDDLDGFAAELWAAGIDVEVQADAAPNGRFARLSDPEGNAIESWEPAPT